MADLITHAPDGAHAPEDWLDGNPADKQAHILNGAAIVFAQDGYEGASMSRIATEARVSKGTLYNYFASKADLFTAYVRRDCARWIALVFEELGDTRPPEPMLREIGLRTLSMLLADPALTMYRMVIAEAEKFPELAEAFYKAGPAHAVSHVAAYLRAAAARGELAIEDCDVAAEQFFALLQTHLAMKRRLRLISLPAQSEIARVVDCAVKMFLSCYGPLGS